MRIDSHARAGLLLVEPAARQFAVIRHRLGIEQHFALCNIGMTTLDQLRDQRHHVAFTIGARQHEVRGARLHGRPQAAQRIDIGMKLRLGLFRNFPNRFIQRQVRKIAQGPVVDLVIDVGDVADVIDVIRPVFVT